MGASARPAAAKLVALGELGRLEVDLIHVYAVHGGARRLERRGIHSWRTQAAYRELDHAHRKALIRLDRIERRHRLHDERLRTGIDRRWIFLRVSRRVA